MNSVSCLFFQIHEIKEAGNGEVVSKQVEYFSVEVFMEMFQTLQSSERLP
jgi:hypothetical protein